MESTSAGERYSRERRSLFRTFFGGDFPIIDGWGSSMTRPMSRVPPVVGWSYFTIKGF
jgi:hypothetical protein